MQLCEIYLDLLSDCLPQALQAKCTKHNQVLRLVLSVFGYACHRPEFFKSYKCLAEAVQSDNECVTNHIQVTQGAQGAQGTQVTQGVGGIKGIRSGGNEQCARMPGYYDCAIDTITETCSFADVTVFDETIKHFGCTDIIFGKKKFDFHFSFLG